VVEAVFAVEEALRIFRIAGAASRQHHHVAASAKAAALSVVDDDDLDRRIVAPGEKHLANRVAHLARQGVNRLGPVQANPADIALG